MSALKFKRLRHLFIMAVVALFIVSIANTGAAFDEINTNFFGVAIKGYDTVAYHTDGRALKGKSTFNHKWNDAKWYFTTAKNRDLFIADPERYAPQYGGY